MTKEEISKIKAYARTRLFRKYHNRYLCDLTQYLCMRRFENPKVDLWYALLDFCRIEGITIDANTRRGAAIIAHGGEILIEPCIQEDFDPFGVIEERLLEIGRKELVCEIINLLRAQDYSGAIDVFKIVGFEMPVKYRYQKWDNSEKIRRLGNKIINYLRKDLCLNEEATRR